MNFRKPHLLQTVGHDAAFMRELEEDTNFVMAKRQAKTPQKGARRGLRSNRAKMVGPTGSRQRQEYRSIAGRTPGVKPTEWREPTKNLLNLRDREHQPELVLHSGQTKEALKEKERASGQLPQGGAGRGDPTQQKVLMRTLANEHDAKDARSLLVVPAANPGQDVMQVQQEPNLANVGRRGRQSEVHISNKVSGAAASYSELEMKMRIQGDPWPELKSPKADDPQAEASPGPTIRLKGERRRPPSSNTNRAAQPQNAIKANSRNLRQFKAATSEHDQLFQTLSKSIKKAEKESRQAQQEQDLLLKQDTYQFWRALKGKTDTDEQRKLRQIRKSLGSPPRPGQKRPLRIHQAGLEASSSPTQHQRAVMRTQVVQSFTADGARDQDHMYQAAQNGDSNAASFLNIVGAASASLASHGPGSHSSRPHAGQLDSKAAYSNRASDAAHPGISRDPQHHPKEEAPADSRTIDATQTFHKTPQYRTAFHSYSKNQSSNQHVRKNSSNRHILSEKPQTGENTTAAGGHASMHSAEIAHSHSEVASRFNPKKFLGLGSKHMITENILRFSCSSNTNMRSQKRALVAPENKYATQINAQMNPNMAGTQKSKQSNVAISGADVSIKGGQLVAKRMKGRPQTAKVLAARVSQQSMSTINYEKSTKGHQYQRASEAIHHQGLIKVVENKTQREEQDDTFTSERAEPKQINLNIPSNSKVSGSVATADIVATTLGEIVQERQEEGESQNESSLELKVAHRTPGSTNRRLTLQFKNAQSKKHPYHTQSHNVKRKHSGDQNDYDLKAHIQTQLQNSRARPDHLINPLNTVQNLPEHFKASHRFLESGGMEMEDPHLGLVHPEASQPNLYPFMFEQLLSEEDPIQRMQVLQNKTQRSASRAKHSVYDGLSISQTQTLNSQNFLHGRDVNPNADTTSPNFKHSYKGQHLNISSQRGSIPVKIRTKSRIQSAKPTQIKTRNQSAAMKKMNMSERNYLKFQKSKEQCQNFQLSKNDAEELKKSRRSQNRASLPDNQIVEMSRNENKFRQNKLLSSCSDLNQARRHMLNTATASNEAERIGSTGGHQNEAFNSFIVNANSQGAGKVLNSGQDGILQPTGRYTKPRPLVDVTGRISRTLVQTIGSKTDQSQEDRLNRQAHQMIKELNLDSMASRDVEVATKAFRTMQNHQLAEELAKATGKTNTNMESLELSPLERDPKADQQSGKVEEPAIKEASSQQLNAEANDDKPAAAPHEDQDNEYGLQFDTQTMQKLIKGTEATQGISSGTELKQSRKSKSAGRKGRSQIVNFKAYQKFSMSKRKKEKGNKKQMNIKLLSNANLSLSVSQDRINILSPKLDTSMRIQRQAKLEGLQLNKKGEQESWQNTRGIGLFLAHDAQFNWRLKQRQESEEFDRRITTSAFPGQKEKRKTSCALQEPAVDQQYQEVFRNLDLPKQVDEQEFRESYVVEFDKLWMYRENYKKQLLKEGISHPQQAGASQENAQKIFQEFCEAHQIQFYYYLQPLEKISHHNVKFTSILKQSHRYLLKAQRSDSSTAGFQCHQDLMTALRVLITGLNQFKFAVAYLFNISVLLSIQGNLVDALLILKKLHRHMPESLPILHNLLLVQILDEWYMDTFHSYGHLLKKKDSKYGLIQKMIEYSKEQLGRQKQDNQMKLKELLEVKQKEADGVTFVEMGDQLDSYRLVGQEGAEDDRCGLGEDLEADGSEKFKIVEYTKQIRVHQANIHKDHEQWSIDDLEKRMLMEKRNEVYPGRGLDFEISRTPGALNLERFTLFEFNNNAKTKEAQARRMRQLFKEPKEEVNETLVLRGKMARYAAEKRKELIERLALFKQIVAEQKIKIEEAKIRLAQQVDLNMMDAFQMLDVTKLAEYRKRKDDLKGDKAFSTRTAPAPEVAEASDGDQRVLAEPDDSMGSRKAQIPAPELVTLLNTLDDEGCARTESNLHLDRAFIDMIKVHRTYCVGQEDPVLSSYKQLVDDVRQLHLKFKVSEFVAEHEKSVRAGREVEVVGQTQTLAYLEQIAILTEPEKMMKQITSSQSTQRARCFILGILQEKSAKEKRKIIKNLEFLAEEAENSRHRPVDQSHQKDEMKELAELIQLLLCGIACRLQSQRELEEGQETNTKFSAAECAALISQIDSDILTDVAYVTRLTSMKNVIESALALASVKDGAARAQREHARAEHQVELASLGIDEETAWERKEMVDYLTKEDSLFGDVADDAVHVPHDGQHDGACGMRGAALKKVLKEMCETDILSRTHRFVPGCEPEDLFAETEQYPQIYAYINHISELFAMTIDEFLTLDEVAAQPQYRKWRYARQAAKERIGMVREENEERERQAAASSLQAMAEVFKRGGRDASAGDDHVDECSRPISKSSKLSSAADRRGSPHR